MKVHTTNYLNSFIEVAEDTKAVSGTVPLSKGDKKTVAEMQYELISNNPYKYTSDELLFLVFATRNDLTENEYTAAREAFFSKGQACFRASPLTKSYGYGVHFDKDGKMALYGMETKKYQDFSENTSLQRVKAMRSSRK